MTKIYIFMTKIYICTYYLKYSCIYASLYYIKECQCCFNVIHERRFLTLKPPWCGIKKMRQENFFRHWIDVEYKCPVDIGEYCAWSYFWGRQSVRNAKQANNIHPAGFKPTVPLITMTHWTTLSLDLLTHRFKGTC